MSLPTEHEDGQRQMFRAYVTIQVDVSMDICARDDQHAWEIVSAPQNRHLVAERLQGYPAHGVAQAMSLQGYVEPLTEESRVQLPPGALYIDPKTSQMKLILPRDPR